MPVGRATPSRKRRPEIYFSVLLFFCPLFFVFDAAGAEQACPLFSMGCYGR
jgi:hypothetical protein